MPEINPNEAPWTLPLAHAQVGWDLQSFLFSLVTTVRTFTNKKPVIKYKTKLFFFITVNGILIQSLYIKHDKVQAFFGLC